MMITRLIPSSVHPVVAREGGMAPDMPAAVSSKGSTPQQRVETTTVSRLEETIREKALEAPGIMVIGEVSKLHDVLGDLR